MRCLIPVLGLLLLFSLAACSKKSPPKPKPAPSVTSLDGVPLGADLAGGLRANQYQGLTCEDSTTHRGLRAWRRLSNVELVNTIQDVFGSIEAVDFGELVNDIPKHEAFDTVITPENFFNSNRLKGYLKFAETLSSRVDIKRLFPCVSEGAGCIRQTIPKVGADIWRRPLAEDEIARLVSLHETLTADGADPEQAMRFVLQALVLSPHFLYRPEFGELQADGSFLLTDWEIASSLSYLLWRRPPDAALRAAAQSGALRSPEGVKSQAERLMADPKAREAMADFAGMWLNAGRVQTVMKPQAQFTADVKTRLVDEAKNFFVHTMFDAEAKTFDHLMNADYTIGDASVGFIYGSTPGSDGRLPFVQSQRRGVLGQAGFLASHAFPDQPNPIMRGVFVAERLLCVGFVPPPAVNIPEPQAGLSNKERFRRHSEIPACASCHATIDALGFALENFDAIGVFRDTDAGQPIVVDGKLRVDGQDATITSPQSLSQLIGKSRQGLQCFVRQNFRYGLGRMEFAPRDILGAAVKANDSVQSELDRCQIEAITAAMEAQGGNLRNAILELVASPAFRIRLIGEPEQ
ncbi:DUF1592 domain-containing protein [Oligoflexus tunisiensis]|uniref:DUF1592 domain-containing protein n=1 Tax=Oligoflexus tunisiensis TaxID=708132 RepID=UPI00159EF8C3|nr:DUF1592 domain-containing protein [Oligoflexus tunisiensis]